MINSHSRKPATIARLIQRRHVGHAEEAIAEAVDHVEERIQMRHRCQNGGSECIE